MKKTLLLVLSLLACFHAFADVERVIVKDGKFYTENTKERFVPVGANYIRLNSHPANKDVLWHSTFSPKDWDKKAAENALKEMRAAGMNVARVFIDPFEGRGCIENEMSNSLSRTYMGNLIDFLGMAQDNGIRVIIAFTYTPLCPMTTPKRMLQNDMNVAGENVYYLNKNNLERKKLFLREFTRYLKQRGKSCFKNIFAIELQNEEAFLLGYKPLDGKLRRFKAPNGKSYNLKTEEDVQKMLDECTVYYIDNMVDAVRQVERDMLVSTSVFTFAAVQKSGPNSAIESAADAKVKDKRYPFRPLAMLNSKVSYVDIHFYLNDLNSEMPRHLESVEFDELKESAAKAGKPIIIGEIGIHRAWADSREKVEKWFNTIFNAFAADDAIQGFLWWTWDCFEQKDWIEAKDENTSVLEIMSENFKKFEERVKTSD